jgi:hypothetical protein
MNAGPLPVPGGITAMKLMSKLPTVNFEKARAGNQTTCLHMDSFEKRYLAHSPWIAKMNSKLHGGDW